MADELRRRLHAALARAEDARRPEDFVHASAVTSTDVEFCPRQWALMRRDGLKERARSVSAAQQFVYEVGHAYQGVVTGLLADCVLGTWECAACGWVDEVCRRPRERCKCGSSAWRHVETRFVSRSTGIGAGIDLLVDLGGPKLTIVEVKGEQKNEFQKLVMPRAEHRLRTSLYLRVAADSGDLLKRRVDTERALVLYVSKGGFGAQDEAVRSWKVTHDSGTWSPFKEFEVARDDALTQDAWDKGAALARWRKSGELPGRVCGSQVEPRAKACCAVWPCFRERG